MFNPLKLFTEIIKSFQYLDKHGKFFVGLIGSVLLISFLSYWDKNRATLKQYESLFFFILMSIILICTIIAFIKYIDDLSYPNKKKGVNLIAWEGFGEDPITEDFKSGKKTPLDVLEYVRGLDRLTTLKYNRLLFDVLIADIEYLRLHNVSNRLVKLEDSDFKNLWEKIPNSLQIPIREQGELLGIPVRCGLNDIVLNLELSKDQLPNQTIALLEATSGPNYPGLSYSDFSLEKLLVNNSDRKIGLWNWYLPTLSVLLLTKGISPIEKIWQQTQQTIEEITEDIVKNRNKFLLYDTPERATFGLENNEVWILFGGGTCLLPGDSELRKKFKSVIPEQGAILWVECASMLADSELSKSFIDFILQKDVQCKLANRRAYRACPVTIEALSSMDAKAAELAGKSAIFEFNNLRPKIKIRQLPSNWRAWEDCWDFVNHNVSHAQ